MEQAFEFIQRGSSTWFPERSVRMAQPCTALKLAKSSVDR
ncbi:MAG: hypothetical protein MjAS7_1638 [Metallosphaera javensis (ex Sakai et al. 2022)]|nr:MAG: hypothetical protein MjAS7_1638 [Metallosphaera javensis (ex Sakai et al. 2022)]